MKDEELILKAVEYCNDIPARVKDFLWHNDVMRAMRQTEITTKEEPKPEFKVGDWIIGIKDYLPNYPARISKIDGDHADITITGGENYRYRWIKGVNVFCRLATPQEIESHLKKIADEKYIGEKVRCLIDESIFTIAEFSQYTDCDSLWYKDEYGRIVKVYGQGEWATIVLEKKKLPNDRKGISELIGLYHDQNDGLPFKTPIDEFLSEYRD